MLERFQGDNAANLITALLDQQCVAHDVDLANAFAAAVTLCEVNAGDAFITQGGEDNDVYFILAGSVAVRVNGVDVASRHAGLHVGEMAALHPASKRSATVVATETCVLAKLSEPALATLGSRFPSVWKRLAIELASRIRQRAVLVRQPNDVPVVFIGSSVEGLPIAREIQAGLSHERLVARLWTGGVFTPSDTTINALEAAICAADFGVLVCTRDDTVESRGATNTAPRDNVIFELGMCVGHLGSRRTILVRPRDKDLKIPTDLLGVTPVDYRGDDPGNLEAHIGPVCTAISKVVSTLGLR